MTAFSVYEGTVVTPPMQFSGLALDTTPKMQTGALLQAVDNWWGCGEFIYARAAGTIRQFGLVVLTPVFDSTLNTWRYDATEVPNTANLGREVLVAMNAMTSGQYSWFQVSGISPVNCQASVAADTTFGIAAAGQGGANSAGKQLLGGRVIAAGATTVVKANCIAPSGSNQLNVPNAEGWFVGAYLSGTGIAGGTTVTAISADGRTVTLSAVTTAAVAGSVTATYNNGTVFYNVARFGRMFAQGAIT